MEHGPVDRPSTRGIDETAIAGQRYSFGGLLGRGGMGEVLEAHDEQIGREVAVKRLRAENPNSKQIARFMREARIQGRLEHPAIVPVHELGLDADGRPYFAMKKLAGTTLAQILAEEDRARYPRQRLLRALSDVCLAVELAHTRGFVHRDLKPENIMLGDFGETYVLDWGVAKVTGEDDSALVSVDAGTNPLVTAAGALVGTPGYMSPEQVRGDADVDGRADVYALGSIMFEVLAGTRLHPGGQAAMTTTVEGVETRPGKRTPEADVPPELDELCVRALEIERGKRIGTARELGERIQQFLDGDRDLVLRRTLAQQHLGAATAAFEAADRGKAMREAGRALALDPTLHTAAELITRMMLEPPKIIPPEVKKAFDSESADVVRRTTTFAAIASGAYLFFVPVLLLLGNASPAHLIAMSGLAALSAFALLTMRKPGHAFVAAPVIVLHLALIMLIATMFSPFLVAPALAAVTAAGFMTGPQYAKRQATLVWLLCSAGVLVPWLAERAGWIASTMTTRDGAVTLHSPAITAGGFEALMAASTVVLVGSVVMLARGLRTAERGVRQQIHLQAWQLRQLVAQGAD